MASATGEEIEGAVAVGSAEKGTDCMPRGLRCTRKYIELLADPRRAVKAEWRLLRTLSRMTRSRETVVDLLIGVLEHPVPEVRWRAAYLLGNTRQRRALPALLRRVHDPDEETRNEALEALGALGDASIVPLLVDLLVELPPEDSRQYYIRVTLGELGNAAIVPLGRLMLDGSAAQRRAAAGALAHLRVYRSRGLAAFRAGELLDAALQNPEAEVREAAAAALSIDFEDDRYPRCIYI